VTALKQAQSQLKTEKTLFPRETSRAHSFIMNEACAIAQAFSIRFLVAKAWLRSQVSGVCGGQSGTGTGLTRNLF
jgi:hypothetical protein